MALFAVQTSTSRLFHGARLTVPAMAFERVTRTVKQVRFPVHGAGDDLTALTTQPTRAVGATRNGAPGYLLHGAPKRTRVGVQPTPGLGALRAATQGMRDRRSAAGEQAPTTPSRCGRREMRHCAP